MRHQSSYVIQLFITLLFLPALISRELTALAFKMPVLEFTAKSDEIKESCQPFLYFGYVQTKFV